MRTLPGESANDRFDVMTAAITVAMRLWLNGSDWITSTGRRKPGPEPVGAGSDYLVESVQFMNLPDVMLTGLPAPLGG